MPDGQLQYRWDLNGDHLGWETDWSDQPVLVVPFPFAYNGYIGLQVRNSEGNTMTLYRGVFEESDYYLSTAFIEPGPEFAMIRYSFHKPNSYLSLQWAQENLFQPDPETEDVFNFGPAADRSAYGSLWTWAAAGALDEFYHLPSRDDWQDLFAYSGGIALAGYNLQVDVDHGLKLSCAGLRSDGLVRETGEAGYYWTGEEAGPGEAWAVRIRSDADGAEFVALPKTDQASVRLMSSYEQFYDK
ncbi:MAG: hypothetical protein R2751_04480 [Bacteroidales bacterium]